MVHLLVAGHHHGLAIADDDGTGRHEVHSKESIHAPILVVSGVKDDTTTPAAPAAFHARSASPGGPYRGGVVALSWKAPGDDGATGRAARYLLRAAQSPIDAGSWNDATPVEAHLVPIPAPAGQEQRLKLPTTFG